MLGHNKYENGSWPHKHADKQTYRERGGGGDVPPKRQLLSCETWGLNDQIHQIVELEISCVDLQPEKPILT